MSDQPGIAVTLGPCDDMRAEVFVRVRRPPGPPGMTLSGTLVGPECRRATTLPATARFADLGPPATGAAAADLVARAVLTEPAFWTPDLPNLYRLRAEVVGSEKGVAVIEARVGLRRLGARGRSFRLDGRRWVPRGERVEVAAFDPAGLRTRATAAVMVNPDEATCSRADAEGVAVVAIPDGGAGGPLAAAEAVRRIAAWAIHPAVVLALLPPGTAAEAAEAIVARLRGRKGTLLTGWRVDGAKPPPRAVPAGIEWLAVDVGRDCAPHAAWRTAAPPLPLVAWGDRPTCDAVQAALAAWGLAGGSDRVPWDWAGYIRAMGDAAAAP